jgi:hypothetical protein
MDGLNVTHNIYTTTTMQDLAKARATLDRAVDECNQKYHAELKRLLANDALCQKFAGLAEPFSKWIVQVKDSVTNSQADLNGQLGFVKEKIASISADAAKLEPIKEVSAQMDAAGITTNRHTTLTCKDILVQWEQFKIFLTRKQTMLEEEVERERLKGVTPDQLKEIESNFKQFDPQNTGSLDRKAFKACLYSLGEEKTNLEIDGLMKSFGDGTKVPYEGYKNFMVNLLGVSDSKEDILGGFDLICRGAPTAQPARLELAGLGPKDIDYFTSTAPKSGDGYDFKVWTDDVFSR